MQLPTTSPVCRPRGVIAIAVPLLLMATCGLLSFVFIFKVPWEWMPEVQRHLNSEIGYWVWLALISMTAIYGVASLAAAVCLWLMTTWAPRVFALWITITVVFCALFVVRFNMSEMWPIFVILFLPAIPIACAWRYVHRVFARAYTSAL